MVGVEVEVAAEVEVDVRVVVEVEVDVRVVVEVEVDVGVVVEVEVGVFDESDLKSRQERIVTDVERSEDAIA